MTLRLPLVRASVLPLFLASLVPHTAAIDLDTASSESISSAAKTIANSLVTSYYNASSTAGDFNQPQPWYWWLSGNAWTSLMEYQVFTNDTTHSSALLTALGENTGLHNDFDGGFANDDQAYWLYNVFTALEYNYEALPCTTTNADGTCANSWLNIATNAFNTFTARWDADAGTCGGGLKWQYQPSASGYFYKNSVTNGGFFQMAARLARYTGDQTYMDWAAKIWEWTSAVGFISPEFNVYDGAGDEGTDNCTKIDGNQWSYNVATFMHGAAHMYAATGDVLWEDRVKGLLGAAKTTFFSPPAGNATGVMYEQVCEVTSACSLDQTSFKSSLARWMSKTAVLVPSVKDEIMGLLASSAKGAAASCTMGTSESMVCGMKWWTADGFDGYSDFGSMLSALAVVQSLLVTNAPQLAKATPS